MKKILQYLIIMNYIITIKRNYLVIRIKWINLYIKNIKNKQNLIPCIKKYNKNEIKINKNYISAEDLSEKDIIPDLYKEEEYDIKSLEKSLESSIDKSFYKNYEKIKFHYYNSKFSGVNLNDLSSNESYNVNNIDDNYIKTFFKRMQDMTIKEVDEENGEM